MKQRTRIYYSPEQKADFQGVGFKLPSCAISGP